MQSRKKNSYFFSEKMNTFNEIKPIEKQRFFSHENFIFKTPISVFKKKHQLKQNIKILKQEKNSLKVFFLKKLIC